MDFHISENPNTAIQNYKFKILNCLMLLSFMLAPLFISAQEFEPTRNVPSPRIAFLRSLVIPGLGYHYIDKTKWTAGKYHLATDVVMILSFAGISIRGNQLEQELETFALSNANTNIGNRNREFLLAVSNFDNLDEYNDFQLRSRNWDDLLPDTPENEWNWNKSGNRTRFQDMRERVDKNNNQLTTIITLMVANRLISGLSAYSKARKLVKNMPEAGFSYLNEFGEPGVIASVRFSF